MGEEIIGMLSLMRREKYDDTLTPAGIILL